MKGIKCVLSGSYSFFSVFFIWIKISFSVHKYLLKIGILISGFLYVSCLKFYSLLGCACLLYLVNLVELDTIGVCIPLI